MILKNSSLLFFYIHRVKNKFQKCESSMFSSTETQEQLICYCKLKMYITQQKYLISDILLNLHNYFTLKV